jgi:hypothetical protein
VPYWHFVHGKSDMTWQLCHGPVLYIEYQMSLVPPSHMQHAFLRV